MGEAAASTKQRVGKASGTAGKRKEALQRLRSEIALNRDFADEREAAFLSLVWTWLRVERAGRTFFNVIFSPWVRSLSETTL